MGDLTANLSRDEFACPCTRPGCTTTPVDFELVHAIQNCADGFMLTPQIQRDKILRIAIHINSGHRCKAYDKEMKEKNGIDFNGKSVSQHIWGVAADHWFEYILVEREDGKNKRVRIDDDLVATHYGILYPDRCGIGRYDGRTHLDFRPGCARWDNRGKS